MTIEIFKSELLEAAGFPRHGFTKRQGGVSQPPFDSLNLAFEVGDDPAAVRKNWHLFKSFLDVDAPLARVRQVHGAKVVDAEFVVSQSADLWSEPPALEADAIVSRNLNVVLAVQNADCAPVLLADPRTRTVAAVHAGWRGTTRGVLRNAVRAVTQAGASPRDIVAAIGPRICMACYEVGREVACRFPESIDPIPGKTDKYLLDLKNAVEVSLIGAGLLGQHIEATDACSACLTSELFSRRRDGDASGRFVGFILGEQDKIRVK